MKQVVGARSATGNALQVTVDLSDRQNLQGLLDAQVRADMLPVLKPDHTLLTAFSVQCGMDHPVQVIARTLGPEAAAGFHKHRFEHALEAIQAFVTAYGAGWLLPEEAHRLKQILTVALFEARNPEAASDPNNSGGNP